MQETLSKKSLNVFGAWGGGILLILLDALEYRIELLWLLLISIWPISLTFSFKIELSDGKLRNLKSYRKVFLISIIMGKLKKK